MARENVELVRGLQPDPEVDLASLFRDDASFQSWIEAVGPLFHPEFEAVSPNAALRGRYSGLHGLRTAWLNWMEPWESYRTEVEDVIDAGGDVVVLVRDYGRRAGMEAEVTLHGAAIWTVHEGKIARAAFYADREEALEAAGVSE
jgi:ketosteroid isomerase-like protein